MNDRSTRVQRPLEWMRFDPVKYSLLCDGLTFAQVGALTKVMLHLWQRGPMPEADLQRIAKGEFSGIVDLFSAHGDGLSLDMIEEARAYGAGMQSRASAAGKASAVQRSLNKRSTRVKRTLSGRSTNAERLLNGSSTSVLSMSMSPSLSESGDEEGILSSSHQGVSSEHDGSIAEVLPTEVVESPKREREHSNDHHQAELWPRFDDFWALYDKKIDRAKCESKWKKMTQQEREKAMSHAEAYVRFGQGSDPQYRRHPLTYLNNKNFNDEHLTQPRTNGRPSEQTAAEKFAGAREVFQSGLLRGGLFGGDA